MNLYILVTGEEETFSEIFSSLEEAEQNAVESGHTIYEVYIKHIDVKIPEKMYGDSIPSWSEDQKLVRGWNACLKEVLRLNSEYDDV